MKHCAPSVDNVRVLAFNVVIEEYLQQRITSSVWSLSEQGHLMAEREFAVDGIALRELLLKALYHQQLACAPQGTSATKSQSRANRAPACECSNWCAHHG